MRTTAIDLRRHALIVTVILGTLWSATDALGQTMRFVPIRSAPLGSPAGTIGDPVTPEFNNTLNCWEVTLPGGGVEVHLEIEAFGWGDAPGSPTLGAILAKVGSAGYSNGLGGDLVPKGWPAYPYDGAFFTDRTCTGNGDWCGLPFDQGCNDGLNGTCLHNPDWVMPACTFPIAAIKTPILDHYAWGSAAQVDCAVDDGQVKTLGGLILNVPPDAAGTYVIALSEDPNESFMAHGPETPIPILVFNAACITITEGACCTDAIPGQQDFCQNDTTESDCAAAAGSFLGDRSSCSGQVGACCLDGSFGGQDQLCAVMDRNCCTAENGSFLGTGSSCSAEVGACCLDSNGDGMTDTCTVQNRTCCDGQGGSFGGAGSSCSSTVGACCLDEGTCVEANLTCCESQEGSAQRQGSTCLGDLNGNGVDDVCEGGFPTVSQWGLIVLVLSLLVGIKISFDRRQPA